MLQVGSTVDGWHIDRVIHQGSMAVTFAVSHPSRPTTCAMKLLFMQEPSFQERLRRAGEALRTIRHPNLLPIVDVVVIEGKVAVVSDYIEGTNLTGWVAAKERNLTELVQLFRKASLGLRAAHAHGLVHRNLKPAKILVDLTDHPYVHDFMLGKVMSVETEKAVTQMGTTFGTPQYMAPEQFRGAASVDERADVFSMGCILFEMVTGRRAFDGTGVIEIYQQVANGIRPKVHELRGDCPPALEVLVAEMLAPDPDARIPSIRELVNRLDSDGELRQLVNPSFRTATPVSALTSERPVKKAVSLEAPGNLQGPPKVLSVTPVEPQRTELPPVEPEPEPTDEAPHDPDLEPTVSASRSAHLGLADDPDLVSEEGAYRNNQDSRPSIITFTDGMSIESKVGELRLGPLPATEPRPAGEAGDGPAPAVIVGGLVLLFLVAAGIGLLVASL